MLENHFRDTRVRPDLNLLENCFWFIKEARAIRAIPDIIACINGFYVTIEIKKDLKEWKKKIGRAALQNHHLAKVEKAGGLAIKTCPEHWEEDLKKIKSHCYRD